MKKMKKCLIPLIVLLGISGCNKGQQEESTKPIKTPATLSDLQILLSNTSFHLEGNETKQATRKTIEVMQELFSTKTTTTQETLIAYEGPYAITEGTQDRIHTNFDFESDIFNPVHKKYTAFSGKYENMYYEIKDYEGGKEDDKASRKTIQTESNDGDISLEDVTIYSTMNASNYANFYLETYFVPVLSGTYSLTATETKNDFRYTLNAESSKTDEFGETRTVSNISLDFLKDGFLKSFEMQFTMYAKDYDEEGTLGNEYVYTKVTDTCQIERGKRQKAPQTPKIVPTNYWLTDYEIQLQANMLLSTTDCDADDVPVDFYILAKAINVTPELAIDTKLEIIDSSNQDVISVSSVGVVKSIGGGTTTLTVRSESGIEKTIEATVKVPDATSIRIEIYSSSFFVGEEYNIFTYVTPENSREEYDYTVSNDNARIIMDKDNDPVLVCEKAGEVTITATSKTNPSISASKTVTITQKLTVEEVKANIVGTWVDVENNQQKITFHSDNTGHFTFFEDNKQQDYDFKWIIKESQTNSDNLLVTITTTMGNYNDNECSFLLDGTKMQTYFTNVDMYYLVFKADFIKE